MSDDKAISERLHQIFPSPEVAGKVIDMVTSKRPKGWSRRSHAPYYRECYAIEIKNVIDKMLENKQEILYRYDTWCTEDTGISRLTLYHRVNQSIRYLIECMDTAEHKYASWYESVIIDKSTRPGVSIRFKVGVESGLQPELVQPREQMPRWKKRLEEWLEDDSAIEPFVEDRLALTVEEVQQLKIELAGVKTIQCSISSASIRIIKVNE